MAVHLDNLKTLLHELVRRIPHASEPEQDALHAAVDAVDTDYEAAPGAAAPSPEAGVAQAEAARVAAEATASQVSDTGD